MRIPKALLLAALLAAGCERDAPIVQAASSAPPASTAADQVERESARLNEWLDARYEEGLDFDDVGEMTQKFTALAHGGQVSLALQRTFWGATFGMLTDAFGVRWMFNCADPVETSV